MEVRPFPRRAIALWQVAAAALVMLAACAKERPASPNDRGAGLAVASLSAEQRAGAYRAAMREVFESGPGLVLMLNPALLPAARAGTPTDTMSAALVRALRSNGTVQGTCTAEPASERVEPICRAAAAGYEVQFSQIFRVGRDTVQLYVTAERYRPASDTTGYHPPLRLEQRFTLVRQGSRWDVIRQERLVL